MARGAVLLGMNLQNQAVGRRDAEVSDRRTLHLHSALDNDEERRPAKE